MFTSSISRSARVLTRGVGTGEARRFLLDLELRAVWRGVLDHMKPTVP